MVGLESLVKEELMRYTQGEWTPYKDDMTRDAWCVDLPHKPHDKVYTEIAIVFGEANAHLIAAAPDMYEALKSLRTLLQDSDSIRIQAHGIGDEFGAYNIFEKADKALAKAEGENA